MRKRILRRTLFSLSPLIIYGFIYAFFGKTTILAHDGDTTLSCGVYINGDYKGQTPLELRLGIGSFSIKVEPPEGYNAAHSSFEFWSTGIGMEIRELMIPVSEPEEPEAPEMLETPEEPEEREVPEEIEQEYLVILQMPEHLTAEFLIENTAGEYLGTCNGQNCEIPLPGPGEYTARMTVLCDGLCPQGKKRFLVTQDVRQYTIYWTVSI